MLQLRYAPGIYDYQITRPDGSIIIGGAKQWFWHDKSHWYGVTDDASLIEPAKQHFPGFMQRNYRGWEQSGAEVDKIWTGIMGVSCSLLYPIEPTYLHSPSIETVFNIIALHRARA